MAGFPSLFQSKSSYCQTLSVFHLPHHHCSRLILLPAAASPALSILFRILSFRFSAGWTKVLWVKLSARLFAGRLAWSAFTASASQQGLRAPRPLVGTVQLRWCSLEPKPGDTGKVLPGDRLLAEYGRAATQLQARERTESQDASRILPHFATTGSVFGNKSSTQVENLSRLWMTFRFEFEGVFFSTILSLTFYAT